MHPTSELLLAFGAILLFGLAISTIGQRTFLPRVTLLLLFGIIIGKDMLNIIPQMIVDRFDLIANVALLMVGFLLGGKLSSDTIKNSLGKVLWISISTALITTLVVILGLISIGIQIEIAILLGCIASATAPAAILDVVMETDYKGKFKDLLLSIVALDDAWALILFAVGIALVQTINGVGSNYISITSALWEIGGAVILGSVLGLPAAYLTGRLKPGQPIMLEALGLVFICGGLAIHFDVSYLISAMMMGIFICNFALHHEYPFHAIEDIESPFMVIFFVLAGASLELKAITDFGLLGTVYITSRIAGKLLGARIGCQLCHARTQTKTWMGVALLPQAGVAIGMALVASNMFPEYRQTLLTIVISSTIFFEIIGPVLTRVALQKVSS